MRIVRQFSVVGSCAAALAGIILCSSAQGAFVATMTQVGSDVVVTGAGSVNISAGSTLGNQTNNVGMEPGGSTPFLSQGVAGGPGVNETEILFTSSLTGPANFGTSSTIHIASTGSGSPLEFETFPSTPLFVIYVPVGYTSGSVITNSDTYSGITLAGLGVTPGTYTWTWPTTVGTDSYTINAGVSLPEPATLAALALPAAGMLLRRRRWR